MKQNGIPLCFHPTTLIFVDDDVTVLEGLKGLIDDPCKFFSSPFDALRFFDKGKFNSEIQSVVTGHTQGFDRNTSSTHVDISKLHHLLYNKDRFNEVSVLIVDYQMPKMTGLELSQLYGQHNIEIIMFTGEATADIGLSALNNEVITRFLYKGIPYLDKELCKTIKEMQYRHFEKTSNLILNNFAEREVPMPSFFRNGYFAIFFKDLLAKHSIIEYYILDYQGDFILIDELNEIHYLTIRDEKGYHELFLESQAGYYDEPTDEAKAFLDEIKAKKKMPFLWGLENPPEFLDWPVYPVMTEVCDDHAYWYAWVENDKLDRGIDVSKIKFYTP